MLALLAIEPITVGLITVAVSAALSAATMTVKHYAVDKPAAEEVKKENDAAKDRAIKRDQALTLSQANATLNAFGNGVGLAKKTEIETSRQVAAEIRDGHYDNNNYDNGQPEVVS